MSSQRVNSLQGAEDDRVGVLDAAERLVGEHNAEAEGVLGRAALPDGDVAFGVEAFEQCGRVEPAGAAADDGHPHGYRPFQLGVRLPVNAAWNSA